MESSIFNPNAQEWVNNYFDIKEFNGIEPDPDLLFALNKLREAINDELYILSGPRTFKEQTDLYMKRYGLEWTKYMAWESKHLPSFDGYKLRAADVYANNYTGERLMSEILEVTPKTIQLGLGVGRRSLHVDIREREAIWYYDEENRIIRV